MSPPLDMPIAISANFLRFELVVNQKTAKDIGHEVAKLWRSIEGITGRPKVIGVMMSIGLVKLPWCHSEILGRFPFWRAELHQPRRRSVSHYVRSYPRKGSRFGYGSEGSIHVVDRMAIPFDCVSLPQLSPPAQMN